MAYRDVPLDCFSNEVEWNSETIDANEMQDEIDNDIDQVHAAGGYSYKKITNRFILWKIIGHQLELVEYSTQDNFSDNALRLYFSAPLIAKVEFYEDFSSNQAKLYLFVVTSNNILYRFHFLHPTTIPRVRSK